jgi:tetratricopeptide (TPR) repeat protein
LDHLGEWKEVSLAWSLPGDLWAFPFQGWLSSLLGDDDARDAHRAAGAFLEDLAKSDLSSEIGLSRLDCSMEARGQYLEGRDLEKARAVTAYISGYLERLGLFSEVARLNEELLAREDHPATMTWLGRAYAGLGNYPSARQWYQKAMEAGPEASSCMSLASLQVKEGDYAGARANFSRAEELCRASEDLRGQASALHALASVDMAQGNNDAARQELLQVIDLQRRAGDLRGETATLQNLAALDLRQGNYGSAMESLEASLKLSQASGDRANEAAVLYNMASVDFEKGEHDKARGEYLKSLEIKRALGDRSDEAVILYRMAALDSQAGNLDSAVEEFIKALGIYQQLGDRSGEAGAFFQLGALAVQKNRILEGLRLIVLSSVILRSEGSPDVNQVDPLIDGLATRLNLSQAQFVQMIREVTAFYRRDGGKGLLAAALGPS